MATLIQPAARQNVLQRIAPALGLFFLSPIVAEFVLGNIAIDQLALLLVFAPLYGGGALLIREVTRRAGRGWPTMITLGLAYAVVEEGLVTQTLFNPSYFGFDLLSPAHIPWPGIGAWWTIFVLTLHTVWSTSVSIALIEALVPARRTTPWLGPIGIGVTGVLFALGAAMNFWFTLYAEQFMASPWQLAGAVVVIVALVAAAFAFHRRQQPPMQQTAPSPLLAGGFALLASSVFMLGMYLPGWITVVVWLALFTAVAALVLRWSRMRGWSGPHELALAGGALLTYVWHSFPQTPVLGSQGTVDLIGNAVFAVASVALLAVCWSRTSHAARA